MSISEWSTASAIRGTVAKGEASCVESARFFLDRVSKLNPSLNAILTITEERAMATATTLDKSKAKGKALPPLAGVPVVVKDNLCTKGQKTTCGSRMLADWTAPYDATVVERLEAAGALMVGKANMDEFAMGSSGETSAFGPALNPWNRKMVPGGSSSGSASAVSAGMATLALGSDTGGSVKQPAAFCGLVGLRPTYGRVSRYGLVAFASSLDQVGPLARNADDCALLFSAISGEDPRDSTCLKLPPESQRLEPLDVKKLRVGLLAEQIGKGVAPAVREGVLKAAAILENGGAMVSEVSLPHASYALAAYYVIAPAECSANLARYDGVRYGFSPGGPDSGERAEASRSAGFGEEVKRRILAGTFVLSAGYRDAFYNKALFARQAITRDFENAFKEVDILLGPATPGPAFPIGERSGDPMRMYLCDVFTIPPNLGGFPSLSFPCGFASDGLPVGAQISGRRLGEPLLLQTAKFIEERLCLLERHPS